MSPHSAEEERKIWKFLQVLVSSQYYVLTHALLDCRKSCTNSLQVLAIFPHPVGEFTFSNFCYTWLKISFNCLGKQHLPGNDQTITKTRLRCGMGKWRMGYNRNKLKAQSVIPCSTRTPLVRKLANLLSLNSPHLYVCALNIWPLNYNLPT